MVTEFFSALDLETLTGTKASTWRYWASIGQGPASFKLGRRRVWRKSIALEWLAEQEAATVRGVLQPMTNQRPNIDQADRDTIEDLGVVDDDRTEDLRSSFNHDGGK